MNKGTENDQDKEIRKMTVPVTQTALNTNSKIYFRKITGLLTVKNLIYAHFIAFKECMHNKADITRLGSRTQSICFLAVISTVILKLMAQN